MAPTAKTTKFKKKTSDTGTTRLDKNNLAIAKLEKFRQTQTKTQSWMWLGVGGISALIIIFWGWSLINKISLFNWKTTQEKNLITQTQTDWNEIFTATQQSNNARKQIRKQLEAMAEEIKKQANIQTDTAIPSTTALNIVPTSAPSTTSTTSTSTLN